MKNTMKIMSLFTCSLIASIAVLSACAQTTVSVRPTTDKEATKPVAQAQKHYDPISRDQPYTVQAGDTLYGISFRAGLSYREVAGWNGIDEPYTVKIGQRLLLRPSIAVGAPVKSPAPTTSVFVVPAEPKPVVVKPPVPKVPVVKAPVVKPSETVVFQAPPVAPIESNTTKPVVPVPSEISPVKPTETDVNPTEIVVKPTEVPVPTVENKLPVIPGTINWRWPSEGMVISRYVHGDTSQQGINIGGKSGQPVKAAADGTVVYSGAGLVGYGELIIIKHSNEWLSAYAHNRRRLVAEGTKVNAGDVIAEMGRTGTIRDMLHFEIRRNGKPVDPLLFLPKQ